MCSKNAFFKILVIVIKLSEEELAAFTGYIVYSQLTSNRSFGMTTMKI